MHLQYFTRKPRRWIAFVAGVLLLVVTDPNMGVFHADLPNLSSGPRLIGSQKQIEQAIENRKPASNRQTTIDLGLTTSTSTDTVLMLSPLLIDDDTKFEDLLFEAIGVFDSWWIAAVAGALLLIVGTILLRPEAIPSRART
jgi:hypothetical protein